MKAMKEVDFLLVDDFLQAFPFESFHDYRSKVLAIGDFKDSYNVGMSQVQNVRFSFQRFILDIVGLLQDLDSDICFFVARTEDDSVSSSTKNDIVLVVDSLNVALAVRSVEVDEIMRRFQ